jgi:rod shape-determining protein MreC
MRNLIQIILKYHFIFLFILLEAFSFFLLVQNNNYQKSSFINSSNRISGSVYESYNSVEQYISLKEVNEKLSKENAQFRNMHKESFVEYLDSFVKPNDSTLKRKYEYLSAKVINNSVNKPNNFITLNKGSKHGIKPDMGVICNEGVVGVVKNVSENFSTVISLLNSNLKISAKIKQNGFFGSFYWDGWDAKYGKLNDIPIHAPLKRNDTIVTSGLSTIFPDGILVGHILSFRQDKGSNFYEIDVRLSTDVRSLQYVYVIKNLLRDEQLDLELKSEQTDD